MGDGSDSTSRLAVEISGDDLVCRVVIHPGEPLHEGFVLEVDAALKGASVAPRLINRDAVNSLVEAACAAPDQTHSAVVAEAAPPVNERDASFKLKDDLAQRLKAIAHRKALAEGRHDPDESNEHAPEANTDGGAVDFRSQSNYVFVEAGEMLGTIEKPSEGKDGMTVRGETIPCKRGRSLSLKPNKSIVIDEDRVTAVTSGVLRARTGELTVDPVLEVPGSVDYETGNIDFDGDVVVRGDVKDNFEIRATGALTIHGLVEAAHLHAEGPVTIQQGMAGRNTGTIHARDDVHAGYLDGVRGEIDGCCAAIHEIKECHLRVGRKIDAPGCAVFGGEITVGQEIHAGTIGSPGGIETLVVVGETSELDTLSKRLVDLRAQLRLKREQGENEYKALQDRQSSLTAAQTERLTELQYEQITTTQLEQKIAAATAELLDTARRLAPGRVSARRGLHKGVRLRIRHAELKITQSVLGGVEFDLDAHGEPRCFLNGSSDPTPIASIATVSLAQDVFQVLKRISHDAA